MEEKILLELLSGKKEKVEKIEEHFLLNMILFFFMLRINLFLKIYGILYPSVKTLEKDTEILIMI